VGRASSWGSGSARPAIHAGRGQPRAGVHGIQASRRPGPSWWTPAGQIAEQLCAWTLLGRRPAARLAAHLAGRRRRRTAGFRANIRPRFGHRRMFARPGRYRRGHSSPPSALKNPPRGPPPLLVHPRNIPYAVPSRPWPPTADPPPRFPVRSPERPLPRIRSSPAHPMSPGTLACCLRQANMPPHGNPAIINSVHTGQQRCHRLFSNT